MNADQTSDPGGGQAQGPAFVPIPGHASCAALQRPTLRGASHVLATCVAVPAAVLLWIGAGSFSARVGAAVYGLSLFLLFAVSASFHWPTWRPRARDWIGRLDQSVIFLFIAGTYTPFGLLLGPGRGYLLLAVMWGVTLGGIVLSLAWPAAPKALMAGIYVAFGWSFALLVPALFRAVGALVITLVVLGGLAFTVGAIVYALKRPDPFPRIFGYHEVFHILVVAAAVCHFAAVSLTLPSLI